MTNIEIFKKLLINIRSLTKKEEGLMNFLGVPCSYDSEFLSHTINELFELGREILIIERYTYEEDEYHRHSIDYTLDELTLEETMEKIEGLIGEK